jgi:hypothetical protein
MDPASAAFGVVALFKDAYLTAQFINNTVTTIAEHEQEYAVMALEFKVRIFPFKNLSRLFRGPDGNTVDATIVKNITGGRQISPLPHQATSEIPDC